MKKKHLNSDILIPDRLQFDTVLKSLSTWCVTASMEALDGKIEKGLAEIADCFHAQRVTVWEFSEDGREAYLIHSYAEAGDDLPVQTLMHQTLPYIMAMVRKRETFCVSRIDDLPGSAEIDKKTLRSSGVKSLLSVPLLLDDRVIGALGLGSLHAHRTWDDHLVERLRLVASALSNALSRKRTETHIRESEEFNRTIIGSLIDHITILDQKGKILAVNEAWKQFARENGEPSSMGIGPGVNYFDVCNHASGGGDQIAEAALDGIRSVLEGSRENFQLEYPCHAPSEERWFLMKVSPLKRKEGGAIISHVNITSRKRAEEALRRSEERFREFFKNTPDYCYIISPEGNILNINHAALQALGYQRKELIGKPVSMIYSAESLSKMERLFANWRVGGPIINEEMVIVTKAGNQRIVILNVGAVREKNGQVIHSTSIQTDITDRKKDEDNLKKAYAEIKKLKERVETENIYLRKEINRALEFEDVIGESDVIKYVLYRAKQVASTDSTVLILGETGTGKGLIARAVYQSSTRKDLPFIHVNCASLPVNLIESELFGREKGAFTGAQQRRLGRFEIADGGTIFLDEIAELPIEVQAKLLRVIEDGQFERLGSSHSIRVDVRILASTNRDLEAQIDRDQFREDLFYRLNVFPITMPPLRQMQEDIPALVRHFVDKYNKKTGKMITGINPSTMRSLQGYAWPGNVRELENIIERSIITTQGEILQLADPLESRHPTAQKALSVQELVEVERAHIITTLKAVNWKIEGPKGAAQALGLKPSTLRSRIKKMGIRRA